MYENNPRTEENCVIYIRNCFKILVPCTYTSRRGDLTQQLPCDHKRSQVLQTASCRNAGKDCAHKTQSGRTLCKWELHAPGCLFYALTHQHFAGYEKKELCFLLMIYTTMDLGLFVISCILGKYDSLLAEVLLCHASLCHNILLKFWTVYSRNILKELLCDFV
jgi:hypothetical protein